VPKKSVVPVKTGILLPKESDSSKKPEKAPRKVKDVSFSLSFAMPNSGALLALARALPEAKQAKKKKLKKRKPTAR
jgi:hypothetical protein